MGSLQMKTVSIVCLLACLTSQGWGDGSRDLGEPCSFRSQVANFFRTQDSAEGCMSAKGLICISHKCSCNPTSVYEVPSSDPDSDDSSISAFAGSFIKNNLKKLVRGESSTTSTVASGSGSGGVSEGRCAGRAGSPCVSSNSTCVQHAACQGSPVSLCRCQGIYSTNAQGMCSKRTTVANQAFKGITSVISGK